MHKYIFIVAIMIGMILISSGCITNNNNSDIIPISTNQIVNPPYVPWWVDGTNGVSVLSF